MKVFLFMLPYFLFNYFQVSLETAVQRSKIAYAVDFV